MDVAFLNPAAANRALRAELLEALTDVIDKGQYILGPQVAAFEAELASWLGAAHGIGVNSGSDALTLALRAVGAGPGDEVITTPFTYIAPAESVVQVGARLVFADIDPRTFCLDPKKVAEAGSPRTKALIPVHLFGQAASMDVLGPWAGERRIAVVEDCAQAIGASHRGRRLGTWGQVGCFSFYPTKNLGTAGDGGMCVTSDPGLADTLRKLRVHGIRKRYHHEIHGYNTRLDELQAAILRVKWRFLESWNGRRSRIAGRYMEGLSGLPVELPVVGEGNEHVWHVFALLSDARDALQKHLADRGVPTLIYYPTPLHLQPCFADAGWGPGDFPVAESVARRILPLPMYPELTDAEVDWVVTSIRSFFGH